MEHLFRRKTGKPSSGGKDSSLGTSDIADQVPDIDGVLDEVDAAISTTDQVQSSAQGHWVECCGVWKWVED